MPTEMSYKNYIFPNKKSFGLKAIENYILTGEYSIEFQKNPIFFHDEFLIIKNNIVYKCDYDDMAPEIDSEEEGTNWERHLSNELKREEILGVLVPTKNKNQKFFVIANGDDGGSIFGTTLSKSKTLKNIATISFRCFGSFYDLTSMNDIAEKIKKVKLLDFVKDETKEYTVRENERINALIWSGQSLAENFKYKLPADGFVATRTNWHKAATALFHDPAEGFNILMGMDENSYFGVELSGLPKTIAKAHEDLKPFEIRKRTILGRQGEWFAVAANDDEIPEVKDCLLEGKILHLPRNSEDSAFHTVSGDIRVNSHGKIFAQDARLRHSRDEHADLETDGWVWYARNTAIRSFSEIGVD